MLFVATFAEFKGAKPFPFEITADNLFDADSRAQTIAKNIGWIHIATDPKN